MSVEIQEWQELKKKEKRLAKAAEILKTEPKHLPRVVKRFIQEKEKFESEIKKLKRK